MGVFDKKVGAIFRNWKGGAGQKGGMTIIKGGLVTPLETMSLIILIIIILLLYVLYVLF